MPAAASPFLHCNGSPRARQLVWLLGSLLALPVAGLRAEREPLQPDASYLFRTPPADAGPWFYWWWLNGYVSREGIVRELDAMQRQGVAGVAIFHGAGGTTPVSIPFGSPEWRGNLRFAVGQAARRGIKVSLNIASGWDAGGAWIDREHACAWLDHAVLRFEGGRTVAERVPEFVPAEVKEHSRTLFHYAWRLVEGRCDPASFVDVTDRVDGGQVLHWEAPPGSWAVVRFGSYVRKGRGYTKYGMHPQFGYPPEFAANQMDAEAMRLHFERTADVLVGDLREHIGRTWTHVTLDSVENANPDWSRTFLAEFKRLRGYDARPFLAAKAGLTVGDATKSRRFLEDYARTESDLICEAYYAQYTRLAARHGLGTHSQAAGHQKPQVDALRALGSNSAVMAEFWSPGPSRRTLHQAAPTQLAQHDAIKNAASAAHTYGRRIVAAEAFSGTYSMPFVTGPFDLKPSGDRAFCQGLNRMVICYLAHQPEGTRRVPGYISFVHAFSVNDTWWDWSAPWFDYVRRCQALLQAGTFAADVCYFQGEWAPAFVPAKWAMDPSLPPGFDCDTVTADVLADSARVDAAGRLVLPGGTVYRYLVLNQAGRWRMPKHPELFPRGDAAIPGLEAWPDVASGRPLALSPEVLRRLKVLVEQGVTLVGPAPDRAIGLSGWPDADREVAILVRALWGDEPGRAGVRQVGKGRVIWGRTLREITAADRVLPDVTWVEDDATRALPPPYHDETRIPDPAGFDWIRRDIGDSACYFVVNYRDAAAKAEFTFRQQRRQPELWDPVSGVMQDLAGCRPTQDGRMTVPLSFAPRQSFFVVFRRTVPNPAAPPAVSSAPAGAVDLAEGWTVRFNAAQGGPEREVGPAALTDWKDSADPQIRFYSGQATYTNRVTLDAAALAPDRPVHLELGRVGVMARVSVNGRDCGTVWTAPWRVDVGRALRLGENTIAVEVVNLWRNRLIADAALPDAERRTWINVRVNPAEPLATSGLIGPVRLVW